MRQGYCRSQGLRGLTKAATAHSCGTVISCSFSSGHDPVLADVTAHRVRFGGRWAPHRAAFAFLNWQYSDVLAPSFMGTQRIPCPALPQGMLECKGPNNSGSEDRHPC